MNERQPKFQAGQRCPVGAKQKRIALPENRTYGPSYRPENRTYDLTRRPDYRAYMGHFFNFLGPISVHLLEMPSTGDVFWRMFRGDRQVKTVGAPFARFEVNHD